MSSISWHARNPPPLTGARSYQHRRVALAIFPGFLASCFNLTDRSLPGSIPLQGRCHPRGHRDLATMQVSAHRRLHPGPRRGTVQYFEVGLPLALLELIFFDRHSDWADLAVQFAPHVDPTPL